MDIKWDYINKTVRIGTKGYNEKVLMKRNIQNQKNLWIYTILLQQPKYGKKVQYAETDISPLLSKANKKYIQKLAEKFQYKGGAVNNTTLHALNEISIAAIG